MADLTVWVTDSQDPSVRTGHMIVSTLGWSQEINDHDQITVTSPMYPPVTDPVTVEPGRSLLWVLSDGVPVTVGWVVAGSLDPEGEQVTWSAVGPIHYFDRRLITTAVAATSTDVLDVARGLITVAQTEPDGSIGLLLDTTLAGVTRDLAVAVADYEIVGDVYHRLSEEDGFDWHVQPGWVGDTLAATLVHDYPSGGRETGLSLTHGTQIDVTSADWDGTGLATSVTVTGAGTGDVIPVASSTVDPAPGLLTETVVSATDTVDETVLGQVAARVRARTSTPPVRLTARLRNHIDVSPTNPATGDVIQITGDLGPVQLAQVEYRLVAKQVTVDDTGTQITVIDMAAADRFI